ncbi:MULTISPECIES: N-acetylmuramic acid 6-phosphate etherase [Yersinia]|jgi:N-acetylmuramic acid 6-phosphate etherase|uniref:N-acetylmuramic acid 6-phosphate etherase n=1 Tax=Yersinia intermedia TaxID=631 RepID=A0A0T9M216_YERIN|nr:MULTISPECIES: N-acetylmuramic acid 6-phosphate etherase [Yersinia]AJJ17320.1 N-acetylmuramic acid 6-phosphate etherase [Yersinia intermedia]ARB83504.1 N-acetylmuramic acid 6-phosphate etherase [Yersinia sp. FDAARGOS_228]AVL37274.1 N-acetylmuramic acid 6-phosphate etherase [Yersinia intermedia]MCB5298966.1 N-acetylmuramic acid 6-phosphate etherase [Yersinia intermedia]MDA5481146.1 N-acetylmuramic acid 6-phosphate etherase [Yersinia intermedia]
MKINLSSMVTESRNPASSQIDTLSALEILKVINNEDKKVPFAVEERLPEIAKAVSLIAEAFAQGGRLIYCGAGTSGRLGILDASECPPTYGTPREMVVGLIAGGNTAILQAVENAEDSREMGEQDLRNLNFNARDVLVGIAASGRTPYVLGAMAYARHVGASVVAISCNQDSEMSKAADIAIEPMVGPEVVTGSSRMKAGTAQKLILNMLTTGAMIRSGKVYSNLMVDVEATNAKLVQRQVDIVVQATECSSEKAEEALNECNRHCKTAIMMILSGMSAEEASAILNKNKGFIRKALQEIKA